jgi:ADP-ribose pyrophosphatase YjhB (NUDIX family)/predicted transcriptional regulator
MECKNNNQDMDIKERILKKLMYAKDLTYNELREELRSNKFAYHLKSLITDGFIKKDKDFYNLTTEGLQLISNLNGISLKHEKKPIICVFVVGYKDKKVLINKRKKQPFLDHIGIPGGKINLGSDVYDEARKEFFEETGLIAKKLELKLITNYITYDKESGKLLHHMIGFMFLGQELEGELIKDNREGENMFIDYELTKNLKKYPDLDFNVKTVIESKELVFKQAKRYTKSGEFVDIEFI